MANYFDAPATGYEQYRAYFNGGQVEHGTYSFTTTGETVEVPTYLSKILCAIILPQETLDSAETLFCDKVISNGAVTVSRVISTKYREFHFPIDNGQIANNDLESTPLMIAQAAMTLTNVEFFKGTAYGGGTVIFNLGKHNDDGFYLEDQPVTLTANSTDTYTSFTSGTASVAVGDVLIAETEGGTTTGPGDLVVSMSATEAASALTSGLTFNYIFIGLG